MRLLVDCFTWANHRHVRHQSRRREEVWFGSFWTFSKMVKRRRCCDQWSLLTLNKWPWSWFRAPRWKAAASVWYFFYCATSHSFMPPFNYTSENQPAPQLNVNGEICDSWRPSTPRIHSWIRSNFCTVFFVFFLHQMHKQRAELKN